ncbi:DUF883 family protein [Ramlibacter ginsenosidimutans]|uniref:DUF883 family protein n=1 Tax=Ramlibacter ginsenosidimutans TaxID=502333 RepID=A0A934TR05_9BURK|nr:DUF883 family protein [Ramlibacter ginsenosidimutans]MBK6005341.1 DUF883 family protein [Ramlibacter ginsenosidimutans]
MNDFTQHLKEGEDRLMQDIRALAADVEALLKHAARDAGDGWDDTRRNLEQRLKIARRELASLEEAVRARSGRAAETAIAWGREHRWELVGAGVGLGLLLALLLRSDRD